MKNPFSFLALFSVVVLFSWAGTANALSEELVQQIVTPEPDDGIRELNRSFGKPDGPAPVPLPVPEEPIETHGRDAKAGPQAAVGDATSPRGSALVSPRGGAVYSPRQQADREIRQLIRRLH